MAVVRTVCQVKSFLFVTLMHIGSENTRKVDLGSGSKREIN